jgi:very-short-patch-repair endonuclease
VHAQLDPLLLRQHGVVSRPQCLATGVSRRQLDGLLQRGLLRPVLLGVYRDPAAPQTIEQRAIAATLAGGRAAAASHRMALALWGMRNYRCNLLEITAPHKVLRAGLIAHRSVLPFTSHLVRGARVSSPARTLLDCSTIMGELLLSRFTETWLSTGVVTIAQLERELSKSRGHRGTRVLSSVLEHRTLGRDEADSPAEAALGRLLMKHLVPRPVSHYLVTVSSGSVYELDWCFPAHQLAFELDGYGVHLRSLDAFEHDRFRRNELEIDGWTVLNFTRRQVQRRPDRVVDQVRRLLGKRAR